MKRNLSKQSCAKLILFTIAVGMCFLSPSHTALADDYAYYTASGGAFGTVDLTTGSTIGSTFFLGYAPSRGIGVANGTLYDYGYSSSTFSLLYSINPVAQSTQLIGPPAPGFQAGLIGSANNALYTAGGHPLSSNLQVQYQLYSVNSATGFNTIIGNILQTPNPGGPVTLGLSTGSNTLYFFLGDNLYTVNTSTGAGTLVGSMGSGIGMGPMLFENSTLYGANTSGNIYTIDTTSGAATLQSNSGFQILGLAPAPAPGPSSAPEPTTMLLLGLGLVGLAGVRRKFRQ